MFKLHVTDRKGWQTVVPLATNEITLGREKGSNVVVLTEAEVSSHHARMFISGDAMTIEDLDSRTGTWINEKRISGSAVFRLGDVVRIGHYQLCLGQESAQDAEIAAEVAARDLDHEEGRDHPATVQLTSAQMETLREAAQLRGVSIDDLIAVVLEKYLQAKD